MRTTEKRIKRISLIYEAPLNSGTIRSNNGKGKLSGNIRYRVEHGLIENLQKSVPGPFFRKIKKAAQNFCTAFQ